MEQEKGLYRGATEDSFVSTQDLERERVRNTYPDKKERSLDFDRVTNYLEEGQRIMEDFEIGQREATFVPQAEYPDLPIVTLLASDIHYGSMGVRYDKLRRYLDIINDLPNFYLATNGDDADNFNSVFHASGMSEDPLPPQVQSRAIANKLRELDKKGKIAVISQGNHNDANITDAMNWYDTFLGEFNCPVFTTGGKLHILYGGIDYKIVLNHTYWGRCLGGSTRLFAYLNNRPTVMTLVNLLDLYSKGSRVEFVGTSGEKVELVGWEKSRQKGLEIVFQDGLRIGCSYNHRFVLENGEVVEAFRLKEGDILKRERHSIQKTKDGIWNYEWGWFIGLFLAEGSFTNGDVQLSLCSDEVDWLDRINKLFSIFGERFNKYDIKGSNGITFHSSSRIAKAIVDTFVTGNGCKKKHLRSEAFQYGREFLEGILDGFLDGDGHWEENNQRYDIGIASNRELLANLRVISWLCGYSFRSNLQYFDFKGRKLSRIRMKLKKQPEFKRLKDTMIKKIITKEAEQYLYDIEVSGDSLFCLLNGAVSHNSKLNVTNAAKRLMEYEGGGDCDIAWVGHTHQSSYEHFERGGKDVLAVVSGTFKEIDKWAAKKGIGGRGQNPGICVMMWPGQRKIQAFKDIETAVDYMNALIG